MEFSMLYVGALIALGAALLFLAVGGLCVWGGAAASREDMARSFLTDRPSPAQRMLAFLGVWGPILLVLLLCVLGAAQIIRVAFGAL